MTAMRSQNVRIIYIFWYHVSVSFFLVPGISRTGVAGDTITKELFKYLERKGTTVRPQYCIERKLLPSGGFQISELDFPNITQSYHTYMALVRS